MLNPKLPKKGFRAFAERDHERQLANGAGDSANVDTGQAVPIRPVMAATAKLPISKN